MLAVLSFAGRNGPLMLFLGVFLGLLMPGLAMSVRPLMGAAIFVVTLGAFLKVDAADMRLQFARPGRLAAVLLWSAVGVPAVAWVALCVLPLPFPISEGTRVGMLLCMLAPPGGSAAATAAMLRLNPALALTATVAISLLSPLLLPPASWALGAIELHIDALELTLRLGLLVLGAAALSAALRRCAREWVHNSAQAVTGISVVGMLVVAVGAMHGMQSQVLQNGNDVLAALGGAFAVNVAFQLLGAALFARLGWRDALTVGLVSGNRNVTLAWVAAAPWFGHLPGVELYLAASVFPIFMLPLPLSRLLRAWEARQAIRCRDVAVTARDAAPPTPPPFAVLNSNDSTS